MKSSYVDLDQLNFNHETDTLVIGTQSVKAADLSKVKFSPSNFGVQGYLSFYAEDSLMIVYFWEEQNIRIENIYRDILQSISPETI